MKKSRGFFTLIVGCMFSGKTRELQRLLRNNMYAKKVAQAFKPDIDDRYAKDKVVTHDQETIDATVVPVANPMEILELLNDNTEVVGIDEAEFFTSPDIVRVCEILLDRGIQVIVTGLKQDSNGEAFGYMEKLMTKANLIVTLFAICVVCGDPASMTQWIGGSKPGQVVIGGAENYAPVCHKHHTTT